MVFCSKCGEEIGNAKFCPNCGESQSSHEPKAQYTSQSPSPQRRIPAQQRMPGMMQNMPQMMGMGIIAMIIMMAIMILFVLPALFNVWGG